MPKREEKEEAEYCYLIVRGVGENETKNYFYIKCINSWGNSTEGAFFLFSKKLLREILLNIFIENLTKVLLKLCSAGLSCC